MTQTAAEFIKVNSKGSRKSTRRKKPFVILPFSKESLFAALITEHFPVEQLKKKFLYQYLFEYLNNAKDRSDKISAISIVIEFEYISESYLKDLRFYYLDCYAPPPKHTKRVHFFSTELSDKVFENRLLNPNSSNWWEENYIGYIVVRPLSSAIFGACVLRPYKFDHDRKRYRYYGACVNQRFNLFGQEIKNFRALPFLEQDGAIGACATSALWSALYKTARLFKNEMPAPHEITNAAGISFSGNKIFPNKGLDGRQIVNALSHYGLSYENIRPPINEFIKHEDLKKITFAYSRMGIPVLLGYYLIHPNGKKGYHLVCITGYRLDDYNLSEVADSDPSGSKSDLRLKAHFIKRLYAHNDQFGPYAKMDFVYEKSAKNIKPLPHGQTVQANEYLKAFQRSETEFSRAYSTALIIPLSKIIKVDYWSIEKSIKSLQYIIEVIESTPGLKLPFDFNSLLWDIHLDLGVSFKESRKKSEIPVNFKKEIILKPLPKYIWLGSLTNSNKKVMDVIYDASNLPNSFSMISIYIYDFRFATYFYEAALNVCSSIFREDNNLKNKELSIGNKTKDLKQIAESVLSSKHWNFFETQSKKLGFNN